MQLTPGALLGPYQVTGTLGAGGMGEVYRARDGRLKRDVAIKVLPASVAADPERLARFQREAEVLAALNHSHIAQIYGLEGEGPALIMELVEGPTLADRTAEGALPIDEALAIARQIADALEAAHERTIIHRDLKPANIKLRPDGMVKVLDFGLAKLAETVSPAQAGHHVPDLSISPTITSPAMRTGAGTLLGTATYMSPEQARGKPVDRRTDIWSFGCVLFEMLTGRRAFAGDDVTETIAAIVKTEPDWGLLPAAIPPSIHRLLRRSLQKDPRRRLADIADARLELEEAAAAVTGGSELALHGSPVPSRRNRLAWIAAGVLAVTTAALAVTLFLGPDPPASPVYRSTILLAENINPRAPSQRFAISPDGRRLAYVASEENRRIRLWVRALDGSAGQPLAGTEEASAPFWSPDSRFIAFYADGKLKRIEAGGGVARAIADATGSGQRFSPGSWNDQNVIVFRRDDASGLYRVDADGGTPTPVTTLDTKNGETGHGFPSFLPDGRHFVYTAFNDLAPRGVFVGSIEGGERSLLTADGSNVQYAAGALIFTRDTTLMMQPFDTAARAFAGAAQPLADRLLVNIGAARSGAFSASQTGALVYQAGSSTGGARLMVGDRAGEPTPVLDAVAQYRDVWLSPNGLEGTFSLADERTGTSDIWIVNLARRQRVKFSFDAGNEYIGVWSPAGTELIFNSDKRGHLDLYRKAATGVGSEQVVLQDDLDKVPLSWSRDGRFLLYSVAAPQTGNDLWVLELGNGRKSPLVATRAEERMGQFSPDGRWVAYASNESGQPEIYVTSFPATADKRQISVTGGGYPRWADDRTLFYVSSANKLMEAELSVTSDRLEVSGEKPLFDIRVPQGLARYSYDVDHRGQRFLLSVPAGEVTETPLVLVTNWPGLLRK
jgi:Tol biopolymer transport system component